MREQLIQYVNLLFAGNENVEDIKQEILQNTLDRYDDLIGQGKSSEAAYRLAITGIGDLDEIISGRAIPAYTPVQTSAVVTDAPTDTPLRQLMRAIAIGLYIISFIPLFILDMYGLDTIGLCATVAIVAVATVIIILFKKPGTEKTDVAKTEIPLTPQQELKKSIRKLVSTIGLVIYFVLSFATMAWHITWLVFPIMAAVNGLISACIDLKEET